MKKQKAIMIVDASGLNVYLDRGYKVISITPQSVSVSTQFGTDKLYGKFLVIIEKIF